MPVDPTVLKHRIKEIRSSISELANLTSKPFKELKINEIYSIRYLIIVIVEALVSLCMYISTEAYDETPESYREAIRIVGSRLGFIGSNLIRYLLNKHDDIKIINMGKIVQQTQRGL